MAQSKMPAQEAEECTTIIKASLQYHAKYLVASATLYNPKLVVPHPKNRAGVRVTSMRTRQISGTIVGDGFDVVMARHTAVAVQADPNNSHEYQVAFEKAIAGDPHMVANFSGTPCAVIGTLTHSHANCLHRNMLAGMVGWIAATFWTNRQSAGASTKEF